MINLLLLKNADESESPSSSPSVSSSRKPTLSMKDDHQESRRDRNNDYKDVTSTIVVHKQQSIISTEPQVWYGNRDNHDGNNHLSKKRVTFKNTARVRVIPTRNQYSRKEHMDTWYTKDDYSMIRRKALKTTKLLMKYHKRNILFEENEKRTARGLEYATEVAIAKRKEFISFAKQLVFNEQRFQKCVYSSSTTVDGVVCPERIRIAYQEATTVALKQAQQRGQEYQEAGLHAVI